KALNRGAGSGRYAAFVRRPGGPGSTGKQSAGVPVNGGSAHSDPSAPVVSDSEGIAILGASERSELAPVV
ncbi:MAG: hypothetical protein M8354_07270, partial [Halalkalicoccus sp.]|nr:hypothetical protein [Halalkalicoccus sp.]